LNRHSFPYQNRFDFRLLLGDGFSLSQAKTTRQDHQTQRRYHPMVCRSWHVRQHAAKQERYEIANHDYIIHSTIEKNINKAIWQCKYSLVIYWPIVTLKQHVSRFVSIFIKKNVFKSKIFSSEKKKVFAHST
jgi:hypothetical protein